MRKAEFKVKAEAFSSPLYWSKVPVKQFRIYEACQYRWENTADSEVHDQAVFLTYEEAEKHAKSIDLEVGFKSQVTPYTFTYNVFNEAFDSEEEFELEDLYHKKLMSLDSEESFIINEYSGDNIEGGVIIEWSYEKYVGYARNLIDIGIAGKWPFFDFKYEEDLITGNENSTFKSNYSVLLTPDEVEGTNKNELEKLIIEALNDGSWNWNYFKNNPDSTFIKGRIKSII